MNNSIVHHIYGGYLILQSEVELNVGPIVLQATLILLLTILFTSVGGYIATKSFTKAVKNLTEESKSIAAGNLNPMQSKDLLTREDELGVIARQIDNIRSSFSNLLGPVVSTSNQLSGYMEQLALAASEEKSRSKDVSASFSEISNGVDIQAQQSAIVLDLVTDLNTAVINLAQEIETTVTVLREVADETSFIALNAQIEAARVGAAGRGFMVVAASIRDLSTTSKDHLKRIQEDLNRIQSGLSTNIEQILQNLENLSASAEEVAAISKESSTSILEQTDILQEMTNVIQNLANMSKDLNQQAKKFDFKEE